MNDIHHYRKPNIKINFHCPFRFLYERLLCIVDYYLSSEFKVLHARVYLSGKSSVKQKNNCRLTEQAINSKYNSLFDGEKCDIGNKNTHSWDDITDFLRC